MDEAIVPPPPTPGWPVRRRRLDPRRQLAVVALRQPGVGHRRAPRSVAAPSWPTRRRAATPRRRSSTRRRCEILAGDLDLAVLVGGEAWRTRMQARKDERRPRLAEGARGPAAGDDRRRPRHDPPGRGRARRVPAGADLPDVRDGDPRRGRAGRPRSTWCASASCGRASAPSPPPTRTRGSATPSRPRRSARRRRATAWSGCPYRKYMNSNNDVDMARGDASCARSRRPSASACRATAGCSRTPGTDCHEHPYVSNRDTFARTPAIEIGGKLALELAGVGIDDIGDRRPLLLLPVGRAARRPVARAVDSTAS